MSRRTYFIVLIALAVLLAATGYAGYRAWQMNQGVSTPTASIGGPFSLIDQSGKTVTDESFRGKFMLIYFGYTFCPDVCPTSLSAMGDALDLLGIEADKIKPLFITVDPERDTVEVLADYHQHFHPFFSYLTGTPKQVAVAAKAYRVFFRKAPTADGKDYFMDHTSLTLVMGPDGKYVGHFPHDSTPEQIAKGLRRFIKSG
ncbi:MAG: SCO family protein [Rhodospirillaceae bacterium]|jgi:protein SCO1|nr:SCO family protein [Rhodospirillaceae bacterium]MBT6136332.1 SCO family protein [Rhodospirillaceae bacterium]